MLEFKLWCLCSFLELYNEETTDLLAVGERMDQKLRIMEDRNGVVIQVGPSLLTIILRALRYALICVFVLWVAFYSSAICLFPELVSTETFIIYRNHHFVGEQWANVLKMLHLYLCEHFSYQWDCNKMFPWGIYSLYFILKCLRLGADPLVSTQYSYFAGSWRVHSEELHWHLCPSGSRFSQKESCRDNVEQTVIQITWSLLHYSPYARNCSRWWRGYQDWETLSRWLGWIRECLKVGCSWYYGKRGWIHQQESSYIRQSHHSPGWRFRTHSLQVLLIILHYFWNKLWMGSKWAVAKEERIYQCY